jgi:hypothetical protein
MTTFIGPDIPKLRIAKTTPLGAYREALASVRTFKMGLPTGDKREEAVFA